MLLHAQMSAKKANHDFVKLTGYGTIEQYIQRDAVEPRGYSTVSIIKSQNYPWESTTMVRTFAKVALARRWRACHGSLRWALEEL